MALIFHCLFLSFSAACKEFNARYGRGIYTFIENEHYTDMIPFGDGGYELRVEIDKLDKALTIIEEMDASFQKEEDFHEATQEDIAYEKLKNDRKEWKRKRDVFTYILLTLFIILLLASYIYRNRII